MFGCSTESKVMHAITYYDNITKSIPRKREKLMKLAETIPQRGQPFFSKFRHSHWHCPLRSCLKVLAQKQNLVNHIQNKHHDEADSLTDSVFLPDGSCDPFFMCTMTASCLLCDERDRLQKHGIMESRKLRMISKQSQLRRRETVKNCALQMNNTEVADSYHQRSKCLSPQDLDKIFGASSICLHETNSNTSKRS